MSLWGPIDYPDMMLQIADERLYRRPNYCNGLEWSPSLLDCRQELLESISDYNQLGAVHHMQMDLEP